MKSRVCENCKKEYLPTGKNQKVCKICKPVRIKETNKRYFRSEKRKLGKKQYRNTIGGKLGVVFSHIKERCNNPKYRAYHRYGGRGIQNKFKSAKEFKNYIINELQIDPRDLEIHRIDNNGNYEPGNIEFLTPSEHQKKHSKRVRTK